MFRPQFLAIFTDNIIFFYLLNLYVKSFGRYFTYMIKIKFKIKVLISLKLVYTLQNYFM